MLNIISTPSALALSFVDKLKEAVPTVILGMAMVFAVLSILWVVLAIFKLVFVGKTPAPKAEKKVAVEVKTETPAPVVVAPAQTDDGQLVAILTAAVAAYMADEGIEAPVGGFRVVSFKRVQGGRAWNSK